MKLRKISCTVLMIIALLFFAGLRLSAQSRRYAHHARSSSSLDPANCYDPSDRRDIRLWEERAPGALGDDPCKDIPYLRIFASPSNSPRDRPAILIIPGGGYDRLSDTKEQAPVAEYFSQVLGVTSFVLYYRLAQEDGTYRYPVPMWDGQRAIKLIRFRATQLGVDPRRVAMFGFSAGGHLASTLALHPSADFDLPIHDAVDTERGEPEFLGLGYPVISMDPADVPSSGSYRNLLRGFKGNQLQHLQSYLSGEKNVTTHTPPVFLFDGMDDQLISPQNSVLFVAELRAHGIPVDSHLFSHGKHGAGLAEDIPEENAWPELYHRWLVAEHFLTK